LTTWILDSCDIYRDGGSYNAVLRGPPSSTIAVFLEVVSWDHPTEPRNYKRVWIDDGEIPGPSGTHMGFHQTETVELLERMKNADVSHVSIESQERFTQMRKALSLMVTVNNEAEHGISLGTTRSSTGIGIGLLIGLSIGLGIAYVTRSITHAILAILSHLSEDDAPE
jgi:hypothetical protein